VRGGRCGTGGSWWTATAAELSGAEAGDGPVDRPEPGDPAEIIFTSGTTALPRGVVVTHANLVQSRTAWPDIRRPEHRVLHAFPMGSVAAQTVLIDCVGLQQTMVVLSDFSPSRLCALAGAREVAEVYLVPAMGHLLARADAAEIRPLETVKAVKFSSAPLPATALSELTAVFPRATFYNLYTSTESFPAKLTTRVDQRRLSSIGVPVSTSTLRIVGEDGTEAKTGAVGEVWLRSDRAPSRQYLDEEQGGDPTFRNGWVRTGDLGYVDDDGYVYLAGRRSDFVNVGGLNVSTFRVEEALCRHPAVAEAAVVPYSHPVLGEVIAAFLVLRAEAAVRDLHDHARERLARHERPAVLCLVEELPRNAAGKVVKREVSALLDGVGAGEIVLPRTEMEQTVAEVWAEVLKVPAVSVLGSFLAAGGDSVRTVQVLVGLMERLGPDLPPDLVERPTVAEMAAALEDHRERSSSAR
jgi:acyl-CoA synthetase (AMP-forming)/AMP-acid ligase II/acyl carrier protein